MEDSLKEIDIILSLDNDQLQIWAENEGFEAPKVKNKEYSDFKEPTLSTVSEGRSKYQAIINTDDPILGRQGEAYIFQYLKSEFPDDEVVWHNEVEESSLPYDFSIRNGNEDRYFIEVKTTGRDDKKRILLSLSEFRFLLKNTEKYLLYRVSCNGPICKVAKILRWEDRFTWDGYEIEIKRI